MLTSSPIFAGGVIRADLTTTQKENYISALQCLLTKPSKSDPALFPGAKNRYDDFVVVHINQTLFIHGTVSNLF